MADEELLSWAAHESRRLVTGNVKDFRRLFLRAQESAQSPGTLLYTSSRTFPRSRRNPGRLIAALDAWVCDQDVAVRPPEDWLTSA